MERKIHPEPPVATRLAVVLRKIKDGEWLIPRFQRPFVWEDEQRLLLMDSIYRGLPIGSLITWRTRDHELSTYPSLGGVPLPSSQDVSRSNFKTYLLDGHQRLTTLYAALGPGIIAADDPAAVTKVERRPGDEEVSAIYFDLEGETFLFESKRGNVPKTWLSLAQLLDRYALRNFEDEVLSKLPNVRLLINRVQDLVEVFSNCEIPVISIVTESLEEATEAFQRVNSTGVGINQFHMVNAKLWRPDFDLQVHVEDIRQQLSEHGWSELSEQMILNTCKARLDLDVYLKDVEAISEQIRSHPEILTETTESLIAAARFLRLCGVEGPAVLPYSYQVVLLADAIARVEELDEQAEQALRRWFWASTYAELFAGMSSTQLRETLVHVRAVAAGSADPLQIMGDATIGPIIRFDFRAARSRALLLRMAADLRPQTSTGEPLDALSLLAREGVKATPMLYSTRELGDVELSSRPENRVICDPRDIRSLRAQLTVPIASMPDAFFESHGFDEVTRAAVRGGNSKEVLRLRRLRLVALERSHVESLGLTYLDDP